jgi:hypothetical protein
MALWLGAWTQGQYYLYTVVLLYSSTTKRNCHITSHRKVISEHILQSKVMFASAIS